MNRALKASACLYLAALFSTTSCNLVLGIEEATPIESGGAFECSISSDCDDDNVCTNDSCSQGKCINQPADGLAPSELQKPGDCIDVVCKDGQLSEVKSTSDAPSDDKDCTADRCDENGMPTYPPLEAGTACAEQGGSVCDGAGQCVECVDDNQCVSPSTCGGSGTANSCGCTPMTCSSAGLSCGEVADDGCGNPLNCDNQSTDGTETDVDCGGDSNTCSRRCEDGQSCTKSLDCANSICDNQVCDSGSWSKGFGDAAFQAVIALAVDASGATYATGNFGGNLNLGGDMLQGKGGQDIFLAKFDTYGRHVWSKSFGSTNNQKTSSLAVDSLGSVYIVGSYTDSVDFGGGALPTTQNDNWFVAKFDKDGTFVWNQTAGSSDVIQRVTGVAVDSQGHVVVAGYFAGAISFPNSSIQLNSQGGSDAFAVKFAADGTPLWGLRAGDSTEQRTQAVAVDANDNVILGGQFTGSMNLGSPTLVSSGDTDLWIAKLDKDGNPQWSRSAGDSTAQCVGDCKMAMTLRNDGDIVFTTEFLGTVNFGGGGLVNTMGAGSDIAVARVTATGQHVFSIAIGNGENQQPGGILIDTAENILLCATVRGELNVGGVGGSTGNSDILVARMDSSGNILGGSFFGDGDNQSCAGIAKDALGRLRVGGTTNGSLDMKTSSPPYIAAGSGDAWLAKILP